MINENGETKYCESTGKKCYTYNETKLVLKRCSKKYLQHKNTYVPKRAYMCKECKCYHLTSRNSHKRRFLPVLLVFCLISCKASAPVETEVKPVKKTYYTVIVNGRSYTDLTLYYQTQCGDTFLTKDGKKVAFRGNYMFFEQ